MDGVDGETYTLNVTRDEANRINTDMVFAAEMLDICKKNKSDSQQPTEQLEQTSQNNYSGTVQEEQTAEVDVNVFKWPHEAILLLIEEYRKTADNFCSGKISQKKIWQSIGDELLKKSYNVTGPQCQSKFNIFLIFICELMLLTVISQYICDL
ncbi:unnamed protein product [Macrosiphum euphorbiae]|uniref:Myb/SANT-like DNA-binding domain-containing protein n=2 Tax=Macrosiphum euphorbiae TaxID=13131 RepID=A0AAV0Y402_9HEMI|nr:unnamed protein product [Macrosiphum euphorbiae]